MKLLWIRHGESEGNRAGQIQGRADPPLSATGQQQVKQLANYLATNSWQPTHIYTSPLQRAVVTAEMLSQALMAPFAIAGCPELQEIDNGILQGLTWIEAQTQYPELCQQLESTVDWVPIPEAETLEQVSDRCHRFVQTLLTTHQNSDRLWIVTHGGVLPYLIAALMGSDRPWGLTIPPTALFEFELDLNRWHCTDQNRYNTALWQIHYFNTIPHL